LSYLQAQKILVKAILYKLINKYEVLNFFNIFSKIGLIPAEGRIFHIQNQKFFIPANRRELAEALFNIDPELKALEMIKTHFQKKGLGPLIFLDLGASQGIYSVLMKNGGWEVYAVEGMECTYDLLKINFALNEIPIQCALNYWVVSDISRQYFVSKSNFSLTNSVSEIDNKELAINITTLNSLLFKYRPNVLKIDLEGMDSKVILTANLESLEFVDYLIIELQYGSAIFSEVISHLRALNFENYINFSLDGTLSRQNEIKIVNSHFRRIHGHVFVG
jgi:FkbM family methyltransferase